MIRRGIDINLRSLDRFSMLVHGDYNTFKTYLVGSFMASLIRQGKRVIFWNMSGESLSTLANFPEIIPKEHIWTLETYQDLEQASAELLAKPVDGLGVDSGKLWAAKLTLKYTDGEDRPLRVPKGRGDGSSEWPNMIHKMTNMMVSLRQYAEQVITTCPSDLAVSHLDPSTDAWTKVKKIAPDLPGQKLPSASNGWFDFVGYAEVQTVSQGERRRLLHFENNTSSTTRANVVTAFKEAIKIPDCSPPYKGPNAWEIVQAELLAHLGQKG